MEAASIQDMLDKLGQLPAMPAVVQEVINSFDDPNLDVDGLAQKIGHDQGLSTRVLRIANSSFYGLPRQVSSIHDAVVVMGFSNIRSLALAAGFVHTFPQHGEGMFDRKQFWRHSIQVAAAARALAKQAKLNAETAFTAGLLHDIGQMVLDACLHDIFDGMLQRLASEGGDLPALERKMLGFDHAMAGAEMAKLWNFPEAIRQAILSHHNAVDQNAGALPALIHLANCLVEAQMEGGVTSDDLLLRLPSGLCTQFSLDAARLETCIDAINGAVAGASVLLEE